MANWCDNIVRFKGDKAKVAATLELFAQLEKDNANRVIVIPDYITAENKAMIDISVQSDFIYYRSRWQPNLQALQQIADHFGVGFTNRYAEPDTYIWGEATYAEGHGEDIHLENEDFQRFTLILTGLVIVITAKISMTIMRRSTLCWMIKSSATAY